MTDTRKTILVSSPVYGIEELLDRIYTLLTSIGYEVWMSHKGTVPVSSQKTAFENCIEAVDKSDLFLGIITPSYGSGIDGERGLSITHLEIRRAIKQNKPRWILAHDHVVFARQLLMKMDYRTKEDRQNLELKKSAVFEDLRIIDLYEEATMSQIPLKDRKGNWVQKFDRDEDAMLYASSQFFRYQEAEAFISENLRPDKEKPNE